MSTERRQLELDETAADAGAAYEPTAAAASTPSAGPTPVLAGAGLDDSAGAPDRALAGIAPLVRGIVLTLALIAAANIAYFVLRFVLADDGPLLHPAFRARLGTVTEPGRFGELLQAIGGTRTTIVRLLVVSTLLLLLPLWFSWRHPRNTMAQIFSVGALLGGQQSLAVAVLTSTEHMIVPRTVSLVLYSLLSATGLLLLAVSPNGKPVPRWALRLWPLAWVPFLLQALHMFQTRGFSRLLAVTGVAVGGLFLGFQWYRYRRRATLRQRHQIKWMAYAVASFLGIQLVAIGLVLPLLSMPGNFQPLYKLLYEVLIGTSYLVGLLVGMLSAIRYRLWDVDRLINRTIVYALLTLMLALFLAIAYFALRAALYDVLAPGPAAALSFAAVAAVLAPVRRRIIRWTDRRFYGIRIDYERLAARAHRASLPATGPTFAAYDELVLLGRGGMGAVYRAHHPDFGVPVALKVMSPELVDDAAAQARFQREAHILEGVKHPNVVPFLASGHNEGLAFIAMEYIDGEDLAAILRRRGRLSAADATALLAGVAAALDATHALGIVHRDVKPANILVTGPEGAPRPMLMDFGVARWSEAEPAGTDSDNPLIGSLPYVAPEQIRQPNAVDGRADVYALGVTAYELVTGRLPFRSSSALGLVMAHLNQPPPDPRALVPELPARTARAILRALAKDPADRFADATEMVAAMRPD